MAITFDGPNKLMLLSLGTTVLEVPDLYSRWKDWVALGNAQYAPAFASVGGDPIDPGAGTSIPPYAFLLNGWRIRPQEASHTLNVVDGVLLVDGGGDPFVDTLGSFIVRINYQQPVQAIGVATGGGGGGLTAQQVWEYVLSAGLPVGSAGRRLFEMTGLLHLNSKVDNTVHGANGTTTARLRQFASAAACAASTDGAADGDEGEVARYTVTTTYDGVGQIKTHSIERVV